MSKRDFASSASKYAIQNTFSSLSGIQLSSTLDCCIPTCFTVCLRFVLKMQKQKYTNLWQHKLCNWEKERQRQTGGKRDCISIN